MSDAIARIRRLQRELAKTRSHHARLAGQVTREQLALVVSVDDQLARLGGTLRSLRLSCSLSQATVSAALGKRSNVMSRLERHGFARVSLARYAKLLALYSRRPHSHEVRAAITTLALAR